VGRTPGAHHRRVIHRMRERHRAHGRPPGLADALLAVDEADGLVCWDVARLARSTLTAAVVSQDPQARGKGLHFV